MGKRLKILTFGWELPPFNSGGLGVACYGLSSALENENVEVLFVLPRRLDVKTSFRVIFPDEIEQESMFLAFSNAYTNPSERFEFKNSDPIYGMSLFDQVEFFARFAKIIAEKEDFDIIHAHDWLSFKAGIVAHKISGKPLVVHIHSTALDRTGQKNPNSRVFQIEKEGMEKADRVIAVSNHTKDILENEYGIDSSKIQVIHNRIDAGDYERKEEKIFEIKKDGKKIVLFAGRITLQKGPEYFIDVAKKVLEYDKNVLFIMAGSGDMEKKVITQAAIMGISDKVLFTGFLRGEELTNIFKMADIFVMPSVSEPFGIAALESIAYGTPVIISNQSGVSEVVKNALKVDFWDIDEMTNKILSVLQHPALEQTLKDNGKFEIGEFSWDMAAKECINLYNSLLSN